jgi:hypothetical protein
MTTSMLELSRRELAVLVRTLADLRDRTPEEQRLLDRLRDCVAEAAERGRQKWLLTQHFGPG